MLREVEVVNKTLLKICNTSPALPGLHAIHKLTCSLRRKFRSRDSTSGLLRGQREESDNEGVERKVTCPAFDMSPMNSDGSLCSEIDNWEYCP